MQHHLRSLAQTAKLVVIGQGQVFTLMRAEVYVGPRKSLWMEPAEDRKIVMAEAISRRSNLDPPNETLGLEIAAGRALKALARKVYGNGKTVIQHRFMG